MTTSIQREFNFHAANHINSFMISYYSVNLFIEVETDSSYEQNVAMDRIKLFIYDIINDAVFVNVKNKKAIDNYESCGIRVCSLPEDPYEQIINVMLYKKLNAIVEDRMTILELSLTSTNSDGMVYIHDIDEPTGPFEADGWWSNSDMSISGVRKSKDKVVTLFGRTPSWDEVGLSWKEKELTLTPDIPFQTT